MTVEAAASPTAAVGVCMAAAAVAVCSNCNATASSSVKRAIVRGFGGPAQGGITGVLARWPDAGLRLWTD